MSAKPSPFIWYDLMTTDPEAAAAFYSDVVGWTITDSGVPGMAYSVLKAGETMVGGMMALPEGAAEGGLKPMWNAYIHSADVDADARRVESLGGRICKAATDIPTVGRFAVAADCHGAMFNLFKPLGEGNPTPVPPNTPGHVGWRELHAGNGQEAFTFYAAMFGWTPERAMDMGPAGVYQLFAAGGDAIGGMMTKTAAEPEARWVFYFNVEAIDAAAARVVKGGGKIVQEPMEVPTGQWIVTGSDPQGAEFALLAPRR
jgi:hypothetical protein